ncbi:hypothetical protein ACWD4N_29480 [Streptomyces sp. NPDC002586]
MIKPYGPYDFMPPIRTFPLASDSVANGEQLAREQVSGILGQADGTSHRSSAGPVSP